MADKLLYIVGGPNGAGKTTFAEELLRVEDLEYLGADKIAAELSPANPAAAAVEAGREFLVRTDDALVAGRSCIIESTLSGRSLLRTIGQARDLGYEIAIQFVFLESAASSLARVRERA
jgi:predicted ABC-type ATPase